MLQCDQLESWFDEDLSPEESRQFETHLRQCEACQRELEYLKRLGLVLRTSVQDLMDASDLSSKNVGLKIAVQPAKNLLSERPAKSRLLPWLFVSLSVVVAMAVGASIYFQGQTETSVDSVVRAPETKVNTILPGTVIGVVSQPRPFETEVLFAEELAEELADEEEFAVFRVHQTTEFIPHEPTSLPEGTF